MWSRLVGSPRIYPREDVTMEPHKNTNNIDEVREDWRFHEVMQQSNNSSSLAYLTKHMLINPTHKGSRHSKNYTELVRETREKIMQIQERYKTKTFLETFRLIVGMAHEAMQQTETQVKEDKRHSSHKS